MTTQESIGIDLQIDPQSINLFMQAPVGICILTGPAFTIQLANETMLRLWGKSYNVLNLPILEALPEMADQVYFNILKNVVATGETFKADESEVTLVRNDRKEITYFNFINQPYRGTDGTITGVLIIAMEVTEAVVSRKKIEESETVLRNIIEQTPTPILILKGEDLVLEVANQHLFDLWNVTSDAVGKPFLEILPEMKDQVFISLLKNVFTTGETYYGYETPAVFHRRNGTKETVFVNFIYQPYRLDNGVITGVIVLATDVTEQVNAKQELVQSEERNRLAVEAARLGTYEIDIVNQTIEHSPRAAEIYGYSPDLKIPYQTLIKSIHPEGLDVRLQAHAKAKETGELLYEARIYLPDNSVRWIRLNGKIISKHNANDYLIGTILDITEEKKVAELLEQKIEDRTRDLLKANEELEKSNLELEQYTHVSSHDLQEPLRKITLFTNMTLNQTSGNLDEHTEKNLGKIKESAERMSATLTSLLQYTQLKRVEEFVSIDLNKVIEGVLSDVEMLITEKNANVLYDTLPIIKGIPHQIQQLFYNLVSNALKYSKKGIEPVISIRARQIKGEYPGIDTNTEPNYWEFVIEDNGVGFEQRFAERIFSMFQRLHNKNAFSGTGIGLTLCKKVVENHKGIIWASSEVDKGSKFHVVLPADLEAKS